MYYKTWTTIKVERCLLKSPGILDSYLVVMYQIHLIWVWSSISSYPKLQKHSDLNTFEINTCTCLHHLCHSPSFWPYIRVATTFCCRSEFSDYFVTVKLHDTSDGSMCFRLTAADIWTGSREIQLDWSLRKSGGKSNFEVSVCCILFLRSCP